VIGSAIEALNQIDVKNYDALLKKENIKTIRKYSVVFATGSKIELEKRILVMSSEDILYVEYISKKK